MHLSHKPLFLHVHHTQLHRILSLRPSVHLWLGVVVVVDTQQGVSTCIIIDIFIIVFVLRRRSDYLSEEVRDPCQFHHQVIGQPTRL